MKALNVVAQYREVRSEVEMVSMRERLLVTKGRSRSEHAQNTRLSSRLQELGQCNDIAALSGSRRDTSYPEDEDNCRPPRRTRGRRKAPDVSCNTKKHNTALVERFTDVERVQSDKLERLTSEATTLARERDTANCLLKNPHMTRTKERATAARNQSALEKVLNDLGKLELAEERFLQVYRSITPGCDSP